MTARTIAVVGVLATAALAAFLVVPASRQLGAPTEGLWLAAAIIVIPTMVVLAATGLGYYGVLRSIAVAAAVSVITAVVAFVVSAFTFATALSGSATGAVLTVVLFGGPAFTVVIFGLLALRFVPAEEDADREHEHAR
jgi:hypothetical protein